MARSKTTASEAAALGRRDRTRATNQSTISLRSVPRRWLGSRTTIRPSLQYAVALFRRRLDVRISMSGDRAPALRVRTGVLGAPLQTAVAWPSIVSSRSSSKRRCWPDRSIALYLCHDVDQRGWTDDHPLGRRSSEQVQHPLGAQRQRLGLYGADARVYLDAVTHLPVHLDHHGHRSLQDKVGVERRPTLGVNSGIDRVVPLPDLRPE